MASHQCTTASSAQPEMPLATSVENEDVTRECANLPGVGAILQDKSNPGETYDPFLGTVREDKKVWVMDVQLNKTPMEFHIDARAKVIVIS